jgi:hypothetical protein
MSWGKGNEYRSTCKSWGEAKENTGVRIGPRPCRKLQSDLLGTFVELQGCFGRSTMTGKGPVQERSWRGAARTVFAAPLRQCALFVDLAYRCFPLRPDSPCRGPVFAYGPSSIYLMWLGECHALVVDLSFPLLPCKSFGVPLRVLLFRCFNAAMEIYGYVYHADMLERCSLALYCLDLTKDFGSRSKSVHCSSR